MTLSTLWLLSCAPEPPPSGLPPAEHLIRVSLALRGTRPTIAELEAVQQDPAALRPMVRDWMESEPFLATVRDMWAEILLIRNDTFHQLPALGVMRPYKLDDIYQGTVEEPLELVEYIVSEDRPLTELVTADYMLTDEISAKIYGIPYDFAAGGWQISYWPDDRPRAGLLSSAQVWRRWESDGSNFNRGRANFVASRFLCEGFENRDILVDGGIDIADEEEVAAAVLQNPGCVSCHQSMDPLAGYFWGYKKLIHRNYVADSITYGCEWDWSENPPEFGPSYLPEDYCYPIKQYVPADEDDWLDWGLRAPSYYGQPLHDAAELGQAIAADPRFPQCMARQFYGYLTQTDPEDVPYDLAARLAEILEGSAFDTKSLVEAIVFEPSFAPARSQGGLLVIRPEQYARTVEDLTGFRWWSAADPGPCDNPDNPDVQRFGTQCWGDVDLSVSDVFGYRAMAGGIDSKVILRPTRGVTPTKTLVMAQLAANAAASVVDQDLAKPASERRLLHLVEMDTASELQLRAQIVALHARILGQTIDPYGEEAQASYELYELGVRTRGDAAGGWKVLLTALLQDPAMMFY
jgi:hypothetical protein